MIIIFSFAMQTYCVVALVIHVFVICSCAAVQTYDVYPVATCQRSNGNTKCLTLSDTLNEKDKYFSSNSTIILHKGEHILQGGVLSVSNISNFTLKGYSCSGSCFSTPTITCANFKNFTLWGYTGSGSGSGSGLSDTGSDLSGSGSGLSALTHILGVSLSLFNVSIRITSIHFNHCNISLHNADVDLQDCRFENGIAVNGGALAVHHSIVQLNGTNQFVGNMAERYGGAVYADRSTVTFSGSTVFTANKAQRGGAVYCSNGTRLNFWGNSISMQNTAFRHGGAVYVKGNNTLNFNGRSSFMSNTAVYSGGALYAEDTNNLRFEGNSHFTMNIAELDGGAVYAEVSNTFSFSGNNSFMNSMAEGLGGALCAWDNNTFSFNEKTIFLSNTADQGGAVYAKDSNTLSYNGSSSFKSNTAVCSGGALYAEDTTTLSFSGKSYFTRNTAKLDGGAVYASHNNNLSFNGSSSFMNSTAEECGGAVYALENNTLSFNGRSGFMNNRADDGGAVYAENRNIISLTGNSIFMSNTAVYSGGAVDALDNNTLRFNGKSCFTGNIAELDGGAVFAEVSNTLAFSGNSSFKNNTAEWFGGAVYAWYKNNTLIFSGNTNFTCNKAKYGGAVCAEGSNSLTFLGSNTFMSNTADDDGGAVYAEISNTLSFGGSSKFMKNKAFGDGGAVFTGRSSVNLYGNSTLEHNEAARGGGIALFSSSLYLSGTTSLLANIASFGGGAFVQDSSINSTENIMFTGNTAMSGGGVFVQLSDITLRGIGLFMENLVVSLEGGYGGAIFARSSIVEFQGSFVFIDNMAEFGGGLAFFGVYDGVLIVKNGTDLTFEGNQAHKRGGGIFVEDDPFTFCTFDNTAQNYVDELCFFQTREGPYINCFESFDSVNEYQAKSIILKLENNNANESGDVLYGGHLESCVVCSANSEWKYTFGSETFQLYANSNINDFSKVSSDPYKICICEDSHPNCDLREVHHTVYPGQVLKTSVVAVGQMNGTVPSVIRSESDDLIVTPNFKETQPAENNKECSQLQYPLFSTVTYTNLTLYSDEPCSTSGYSFTFLITFDPCPVGFDLSEQGACICDKRLQEYTQNCNIENLTISRDEGDSFWVGVEGTESDKLILHPHCPFDYCIDQPAYILLNSTDMQCANGRSGILCGACQPGRGLALGSSRCLFDCSNSFVALLLALLFAGVALVAFLFLCHLTVAEGTLSGLIFYANVLVVNQTVFFPSGERNLLTVFIAWLNLDLGLETCFFTSLNAYYRTWLQFAFPTYIWVIVGMIIVVADRSVRFAKIIGSTNPVAILATLFLLSYTKLLRAIMAAFSFTRLDYPDGYSKYVWLYDGNIGYLDRHDGRHIALFLFSLLFLLFVFIPYTLLLLCGQWIQRKLWWLSATKQLYLKFFLDAHYGPYKNRHRYWTGLLLLLRFLMLFVAAITNINNPQDPFGNLLVILVISSSLILWGWIARGFYKKWQHNILEGSLILNLTVLAGGTYQVRLSGGKQAALVCTSVSIAFVTFIGILLSAVIQRKKGKLRNRLHTVICYRFMKNSHDQNDEDCSVPTATPMTDVTYSVVEIDHNESGNVEHETEPTTSESTNQ